MKPLHKPVLVVGGGAVGYDLSRIYELGIPILTSWQGADLVDNHHPLYFGRPGIYGQRTANRVLWEARHIITLGCRLSKWMIGHGGLHPEARITMCDVDRNEVSKFAGAEFVYKPMDEFIASLKQSAESDWVAQCCSWLMPWIEEAHKDTRYINSYRFVERLEPMLRENEIIVTDVGSVMCPVYQGLRLRRGQRLMTSGGLGEMGCGLPAAVGASLAAGRKDVLAFMGDGGMMINLQELQTIIYHNLPVKVLVFSNDGYAMIKGTYSNVGLARKGVDSSSGLGMPDFRRIAHGWGLPAADIWSWNDFNSVMPDLLDEPGPALVQVHIDPEQAYLPRLQPIRNADGSFTPARLDQLSPIL